MSEEQKIDSIEKYLKKISKVQSQWSTPVLAFRGQGDEEWPLASSAERRLKASMGRTRPAADVLASSAERRLKASSGTQDKVSKGIFLEYHQNLLTRCKLKNYDQRGGKLLDELELLADLQHHGAATCLLDFTRNALVALWFACEKGESESDGKVFVVNTADQGAFLEITPADIADKSISDILEFKTREADKEELPAQETPASFQDKQEFWHWSPAHLNERIPVQHSLFLFGPPPVEKLEREEIIVKSGSKKQIRQKLRALHDIHEESLFPDFAGFAYTQRHNAPYDLVSAEEYRRRGLEAGQRGEYKEAIEFFTKAIELAPKSAPTYRRRGAAHASLDNYDQAIQDFTKAIELRPDFPIAYHQRGLVYVKLGKHGRAIQDFTRAIELDSNYANAYLNRGLAYLHLEKLDKAKSDLTTARKMGANITLNSRQISSLERQLGRTLPADITAMLTKKGNKA